jgi:uncharacterized protein HemX
MILELLKNSLPTILAAVGTGFSGWYFGKRQSDATANVTEASALELMQKAYQLLIIDMNMKFEEMQKDIDGLKDELQECMKNHAG